jgi:hypothetical protein
MAAGSKIGAAVRSGVGDQQQEGTLQTRPVLTHIGRFVPEARKPRSITDGMDATIPPEDNGWDRNH